MSVDTREQWLERGVTSLREMFKQRGYDLPTNVKASCGFPSRGALSLRKRSIGQCWDSKASEAAVFETFISPLLSDQLEVLAVLAHECVHATVGTKCGHKGAFKHCAKAIGLEGKMTETIPGDAFKHYADKALAELGSYPHGKLNPAIFGKKQGTRMIKCACKTCGYTARLARKWLDEAGAPICPTCETTTKEC